MESGNSTHLSAHEFDRVSGVGGLRTLKLQGMVDHEPAFHLLRYSVFVFTIAPVSGRSQRCHSVGPHSFKPRSLEPYPLSRIPLGHIPLGRIPSGPIPLGRIPISRCPLNRIPFSRTSLISPSTRLALRKSLVVAARCF